MYKLDIDIVILILHFSLSEENLRHDFLAIFITQF